MRSFVLLSCLSCLLLAIVCPVKQTPVTALTAASYMNKNITENAAPIVKQENKFADNNNELADIDNTGEDPINSNQENIADDHYDNIIGLPPSPKTQAYSPNALKGIQMADAAEGVSLIGAPVANSSGNASLSFAMKLPAGRLGMQPDLGIQYNNEGGSSWLGTGWSMSSPAVSIDTRWGAARYDATLETEIYTLNGVQLAPTNNRSELIARTADKRFYPRVEGSFSKTIRHGNNPINYWWEVIQKNGTHNFYGGKPGTGVVNNAVLKDEFNNIGYWALVESRDANDNFVHYIYQTVADAGIDGGSVAGQQLYLSQVLYTGHGTTEGPYKIEFTTDRQLNESKRKDISIDGRLGFKMVSADLLRKVTISFNNTLVRSYDYQYIEGAFYKTLLKSISEIDAAGLLFYTHNFDYYDDVNKPAGYNPSAGTTAWTIPDDGIKGDLLNPIPGFTGEGSSLSTSSADSRSGGVAVTIGSLLGDTWSKRLTIGGSFNYGEDDQEGIESMIDINGDGLPDKVFKEGSDLFYRANLGAATHSFGDKKPITGIHAFNTSNSLNIGGGVQIIPPSGFFGYNNTTTTTTSKIYFSDFNGDGLMDIAAGGRVYFNHLNAQGNPDFVTNSALTPSPIFSGSIDASFLQPDTALQSQQERDYPLQDIVRMWEAPFTGRVTVTAPVQLQNVPGASGIANPKKDGVRVSIQSRDTIRWSTIIDADDYTVKTPSNVSNMVVLKGQRIYFRVQSRYNGEDDLVSWDPLIEYSTPVIQSSDVQHKTSDHYKASEDFILHSRSAAGMGKIGSIIVNGTFDKQITADSVWVMITRNRNSVITTLYEQAYAGKDLASGNWQVPGQIPVLAEDELHFFLFSKSYIDRSAMAWNPHYAYVSFADATPVTSGNGQPTMEGYPVPDNSNYNHWIYAEPAVTLAAKDTVTIWPQVAGNGNATGTLWFSIRGTDTIYARRLITMTNGTMSASLDSIHLIRNASIPYYIEFAAEDPLVAANILQPAIEVYRDSISINAGVPDTTVLKDTVNANLYSNPPQEYLGSLFRGWGAFALKGDKGDGLIDETTLNLDELNSYPTDPNNYTDSASMGGVQDPSKTNFVMLFPNSPKNLWVGYDSSVYVTGTMMSSSRLFMHDVSVDSLMAGESAGAAYKVNTTKVNSFSAGITPGLAGSAGTSFASNVVNLDMMDMNGDRYPDVLNDDMIQYTLPHGGLGTTVIPQGTSETLSEGWSIGVTLGGNFIEATTENTTKKGSVAAQKTAKNAAGLSGSVNSNDDNSVRSWIDMNGDGLIDRVYDNGIVSLNLGYRFAPGEQWGAYGIDKSTSISAGAGLGVNLDQGSFEAGFGLSRTVADNTLQLNDVNGDGLPDMVTMSGSDMVVQLNTGSGFGPAFTWKLFDGITSNVSTGESINAAFTIAIPIIFPPFVFLKICINPSVSIGHGVSRQQSMVMDIDGDGYPDMLHSDNDGHLTASASTIGRTNMLQTVKSPLGGYFKMDYERVGNTYEMPQSKWVLKNVEVFDGVAGDGIDTTRRQFSYEGGYQDRYEREFYGFNKVTTSDLNTSNHNIVYRKHIQQFLNNTYYNKGLLASDWIEDTSGNKFSQTNYLFDIRIVQDQVQFPALKQTEKLSYEGTTTAGITTFKQFDYDAFGNVTHISDAGDGSSQDLVVTDITYHNLSSLYIQSVPSTINVTTAEGVKRRTITTVTPTGNITLVRKLLADGTFADTDMDYDDYGNLVKVTRPLNYKNQRMWYTYEYDNTVHSYITKVTDAFGYISTSTYDYRFGALTGTVSINNEPVRYIIDNRGRISSVTGPGELAENKPYTIAFNYNTTAAVAYAVTRRYDPEYNSDIMTINFDDGLGRSVQVKKQVSLFKGKGIADDIKMVVSGSDLFDPFGRVEQSYYPILEPMGANNFVLNTGTGDFIRSTIYDVEDRTLTVALVDGATTVVAHTAVNGFFNEAVTDALNNKTETQTDVRGRKRVMKEYGPAGIITTRFDYDALNELIKITDNAGNTFTATYDNLGRKISTKDPDAGRIDFVYDPASNLLKKITAQIRKEIPNGGAIQYQYDYERMTDIDYPRQYQNKVKYTYGNAGTGSKAGRLILQEDASGGQEFFYGRQGELIKTIRTVLVNPVFATTYVSEQQFDSWNRVKKIIYPDGEEVNYRYNKAGGLLSMDGKKLGSNYKYVDQLGYDEYEQRTYMLYGNGAETKYKYDNMRRRLVQLEAITAGGDSLMNNTYSYDAVSNVSGIVNNVQTHSGQLGGFAKQNYHYDNLYRLDSATGEYRGSANADYSVKVSYDNLYNITQKTMNSSQRYDNGYTYGGTAPHKASQVGQNNYSYDENGNQSGYGDVENFWDEENRLMAVLNKGVLSQYTYDADGERVIKSRGGLQGVWLNGSPAGGVKHTDDYTVYVSPYITCTKFGYIKHYYIDGQRIATKQGHGVFTNISFPQPGLTAGGIDYAIRAAQIERARKAYYASLGVSPGPPTDKDFWARPENSGIPAPVFVDTTSSNIPPGWPGNTTPPPTGPPIFVSPVPSNDSVHAGYGFNDPGHFYETDQYFYHPDHLGSTSYITNTLGKANQHIEYSPFGETFIEEHIGSYQPPYLFNAKGRDDETGYYYYGARYYEPVLSQWLTNDQSIDPTEGYGFMAGLEQDINGGSYSVVMGNTAVSDVIFGDDASGMSTAAFGTDEGGESKKSKQPTSPGNGLAKATTTGNRSNAKSQGQNIQNGQRRGFKQGASAIQGNGMFFTPTVATDRSPHNVQTRPRSNAVTSRRR